MAIRKSAVWRRCWNPFTPAVIVVLSGFCQFMHLAVSVHKSDGNKYLLCVPVLEPVQRFFTE